MVSAVLPIVEGPGGVLGYYVGDIFVALQPPSPTPSPTPDNSTPTPDAGTPTPDNSTPTPDTGTPTPSPSVGIPVIGPDGSVIGSIIDGVFQPIQTELPSVPTPDAETPTPDSGTPTPDAETPTPEPGTPTPDTGTPTPDPNTPTPDAETPTPIPDDTLPAGAVGFEGDATGTEDDDYAIGSVGNDTYSALAGNDTVLGSEGDDLLSGDAGNDDINGNRGLDTINGGEDNDTLRGGKDDDSVSGDTGNDSLLGDRDSDIVLGGDGQDTLYGGKDNDSVIGGADDDIISGDRGDDTITGDAGNDTLLGQDGDDAIFGGEGNDQLDGGSGNDLLSGGVGSDTMTTGLGDDTIIISASSGGANFSDTDYITDFTNGSDRISLADGLTYDDLFITQGTGENAGDTIIRNGSAGEFLLVLTGVDSETITAEDFITGNIPTPETPTPDVPTPTPDTPTPAPTPAPTPETPTPDPTPTPETPTPDTPTPDPTPTPDVPTPDPTPTPIVVPPINPTPDPTPTPQPTPLPTPPGPTPPPSPINSDPTDIILSNDNIDENSASGTVIGDFTTDDLDSEDIHTYRLLENPGGTFAIQGDRLVLARGKQVDYEAQSEFAIKVQSTDRAGGFYDKSFTITVNDLNDPPEILVPDPQTVLEKNTLRITGLVIEDQDIGQGTLEVTLSTENPELGGKITLNSTSGITFIEGEGDGTADSTMTFRGRLNNINNAIASLRYRAVSFGADAIQVDVTDPGTGSNTEVIVNNAIDIQVTSKPVITTNQELVVNQSDFTNLSEEFLAITDDNAPAELEFSVTTPPSRGILRVDGSQTNVFTQADINSGLLTYLSTGTDTSNDSFQFIVTDPEGGKASGEFNIRVNDLPLVAGNPLQAIEEETVIISEANLSATDPDVIGATASSLIYTVTALPTGGEVLLNGSNISLGDTFTQQDINDDLLTYNATSIVSRVDFLNFILTDQDQGSTTGTLQIDIDLNRNDAPVLNTTAVSPLTTINENVSSPRNVGTRVGVIANRAITDSDIDAVKGIAITEVDNTNGEWQYSTNSGLLWQPLENLSETSSTVLTTANTNSIRFVPNTDYFGKADISFRAWDGTDGNINGSTGVDAILIGGTHAFSTDIGTTDILVNNVPDIEVNDQLILNPNQSAKITSAFLETTDLDNGTNPLIYQVNNTPSQGSLLVSGTQTNTFSQADINSGRVTYKHNQPGIFTDDSFTFKVRDIDGGSRLGTFNIRVNDPPVGTSKTLFSVINDNTRITPDNLLYVDPDGSTLPSTLQYQLTDLPNNGQLLLNGKALSVSSRFTQANINNNQVTYRPNTSGADSFSYTVRDVDGGTTTGSISIDINTPPQLGTNTELVVQEDIPQLLGITTPTDPDGDSLSLTVNTIPDPEYGYVAFSSTSNPLQVNATMTAKQLANLVFVPKADVFGEAGSFQYTANDGRFGGTSTQVIDINIEPVNDAPVANPDGPVYVSLGKVVNIDVVANDTDIEGDTLSLIGVSPEPKAGLFLQTTPFIRYSVFTDLTQDTLEEFTYTVSDGTASSIGDLSIQSLIIRATDDNIVGDAWDDNIVGGAGNDTIDLKAGNDTLEGGLGRDCLVGGVGNDTFVYTTSLDGGTTFDAIDNTAIQNAIALNNYDQIIGFESFGATGGDVIQLTRSMILTNQSSAIISTVQTDVNGNVLSLTVPALFVYEFQGSSYLIYDSNGDNTSGNNSVILGQLKDVSGVTITDPNDFTVI